MVTNKTLLIVTCMPVRCGGGMLILRRYCSVFAKNNSTAKYLNYFHANP
jgi:hypothetical protein